MLEYVFFHSALRERFIQFLQAHQVAVSVPEEAAEHLLVMVPDDLDDELSYAIDTLYEQLLEETAEMVDAADGEQAHSAAGVRVLLADQTPCNIRIDPQLMSRLLGCISLEELRDLVQEIAWQVEDPDDSPICHRRERKTGGGV